jgi:hypothetical protein
MAEEADYESVKRLWMDRRNYANEEEIEEESDKFDKFLLDFLDANRPLPRADDRPSQSQMLMEMILELDQTLPMVPPRLKDYRGMLAEQGLDRVFVKTPADDSSGSPSVPGINLADQAALDFHGRLLGMVFAIAQDTTIQKIESRKDSNPAEKPGFSA